MGIRIHKVLGYGLTDVRVEGSTVTDPRLNADSPFLSYDDDVRSALTLEAYLAHLERGAGGPSRVEFEALMVREAARRSTHPDRVVEDAVVHELEGGLPNVLVVIPPAQVPEWSRYADEIDWVEQSLRPDFDASRVEVLPSGPFPYTSLVDARSGRLLDERAAMFQRVRANDRSGLAASDRAKALDIIATTVRYQRAEDLDADSGPVFTCAAEAVERIVPEVPAEVRSIADFGRLFTAGDVWKQLRPVLYTFWA